jgi:diguanylate cyclase (GGDEF)-like protein/PAS domain S-box-containing protein
MEVEELSARYAVAFLCSPAGVVTQVLRDDLRLSEQAGPGQPLAALFDLPSAARFEQFLENIRLRKAAAEWKFKIETPEGSKILHLAGGITGEALLIVGGLSQQSMTVNFYEALMKVNNEQINMLRQLVKEQSLASRALPRENAIYQQMTTINNELMTLQRELAKKNADLDQERERYRIVSELVSDFAYAFRVGPAGRLEYEWVTDAFERITGYPADRLKRPAGFKEILHPDDREMVEEWVQSLLQHGREDTCEYRIITRSGQTRWIQDTNLPVWDPTHSKIIRIYGAARDITTQHLAQQSLSRAQNDLQRWAQELEKRNQEISLLGELSRALQQAPGFEESHQAIRDFGLLLFPNLSGMVLLLDDSSQESALQRVAEWGYLAPGERIPIASLPINTPPNLFGEIQLWGAPDSGSLNESEYQLATAFADQVSLAYSNQRLRASLREQAIYDPLTSLYNRRYFFEILERDLQLAVRRREPMSLMMFDLDHFKNVNDTWGHLYGDAVLQAVASLIKSQIRSEDIACRYGGEEFAAFFPQLPLDGALKRAEQIRQGISELAITIEGQKITGISISAGVAAFPDHGHAGLALLRQADQALYRAKANGRNRVESA